MLNQNIETINRTLGPKDGKRKTIAMGIAKENDIMPHVQNDLKVRFAANILRKFSLKDGNLNPGIEPERLN